MRNFDKMHKSDCTTEMPIIEIWQHKKSSKGRWLGTSAGQCQSHRPTTSRWHCHSAWWYSSLPYKEHIHKLILPPYRPASRRSVGWKGCLLWNNNPIEPILVRLVLLVLMVATLGQTQLHRSKHKIIIIHTQEAGPRVMSDKWRCTQFGRCQVRQRTANHKAQLFGFGVLTICHSCLTTTEGGRSSAQPTAAAANASSKLMIITTRSRDKRFNSKECERR